MGANATRLEPGAETVPPSRHLDHNSCSVPWPARAFLGWALRLGVQEEPLVPERVGRRREASRTAGATDPKIKIEAALFHATQERAPRPARYTRRKATGSAGAETTSSPLHSPGRPTPAVCFRLSYVKSSSLFAG
jgi:hypothetical protein